MGDIRAEAVDGSRRDRSRNGMIVSLCDVGIYNLSIVVIGSLLRLTCPLLVQSTDRRLDV